MFAGIHGLGQQTISILIAVWHLMDRIHNPDLLTVSN